MKVALVTTSPAVASPIGDETRGLLPPLADLADLRVFGEPDSEVGEVGGLPIAPIGELVPEEVDRVLFHLGNEAAHGFMARAIRAIGGTVLLHGWELEQLAKAAYPELDHGGLRGRYLALREGAPALNRSVVRHADSFFVHDRSLGEQILRDRNAKTPMALLEPGAADAVAGQIIQRLGHFPGPRTNRKARLAFRLLWG